MGQILSRGHSLPIHVLAAKRQIKRGYLEISQRIKDTLYIEEKKCK